MSQQNVETMRLALKALSDGEATAWFQSFDPDVRVYPRPEEPDAAAEYRGLDGLLDYATNWYSQWDDYEVEPVEIVDAGEHVLVVLREHGRVERAGIEVDALFSYSFVLRDGKIVKWHMYDSHADALEAVGLSEQDARAE